MTEKHSFVYNINFDAKDLSHQIIKLMIFTNNYFKYDKEYILEKYNIDTYDEFRTYFKKNYKTKLLFNCAKSEKLFINFINLDYVYFSRKYKGDETQTIMNFFITGKLFFFNECNEISSIIKGKNHIPNCNCKIKVKSVANITINTLIYILKEFASNYNDNISKIVSKKDYDINNLENMTNVAKNIVKIPKNEINKELVSCLSKLESVENKLKINCDIDKHYIIDSLTDKNTNLPEEKLTLVSNSTKQSKLTGLSKLTTNTQEKNKKFYFKHTPTNSVSSSDVTIPKNSVINKIELSSEHVLDNLGQYCIDNNKSYGEVFKLNNYSKKSNTQDYESNTVETEDLDRFDKFDEFDKDKLVKQKKFHNFQLSSDFSAKGDHKKTKYQNNNNQEKIIKNKQLDSEIDMNYPNTWELNKEIIDNNESDNNCLSQNRIIRNTITNKKNNISEVKISEENICEVNTSKEITSEVILENTSKNEESDNNQSTIFLQDVNPVSNNLDLNLDVNINNNNSDNYIIESEKNSFSLEHLENSKKLNSIVENHNNSNYRFDFDISQNKEQTITNFLNTETELNDTENQLNLGFVEIEDTSSEKPIKKEEQRGLDLIKSIDLIIEYLDVNNNILADDPVSMSQLAIEIKKNIKLNYSEELARKFDILFQKAMMTKIISDTEDMRDYYNLQKDLVNIKNSLKKMISLK